jgi:hypothetical protein
MVITYVIKGIKQEQEHQAGWQMHTTMFDRCQLVIRRLQDRYPVSDLA